MMVEIANSSSQALAHLAGQPFKSFYLAQAGSDETDDGYDQMVSPNDEHPTPDNMWQFSVAHCDLGCAMYTGFAGFMMFTHLAIMAGPLHGWANGNFILLFKSVLTVM